MAVDKPNINLTLAALEAEITKPEPFVLALKGGKRVTFPDLYDMPADEAEEFFRDFDKESGKTDFDILAKWLPKADFEAYKAAKIPLRFHKVIIQRVTQYYEQALGNAGEDAASES